MKKYLLILLFASTSYGQIAIRPSAVYLDSLLARGSEIVVKSPIRLPSVSFLGANDTVASKSYARSLVVSPDSLVWAKIWYVQNLFGLLGSMAHADSTYWNSKLSALAVDSAIWAKKWWTANQYQPIGTYLVPSDSTLLHNAIAGKLRPQDVGSIAYGDSTWWNGKFSTYALWSDTSNQVRKYSLWDKGGSWLEITKGSRKFFASTDTSLSSFDPTTTYEFYEDFDAGNNTSGAIGRYGWTWSDATGTTLTDDTSQSGTVGIKQLYQNGNAVANHAMYVNASIGGNQGNWTASFRTKDSTDNAGNQTFRHGLFTVPNANDTTGIYFRALGNTGALWYAVTRNNGVETATSTGVYNVGAFRTFKIVMNGAHTSVAFYINGTLVATNTTNIPTTALHPSLTFKMLGNVVGRGWYDYFYLKITGLTR